MKTLFTTLFLLSYLHFNAFAQETHQDIYRLNIQATTEPIRIDGDLQENTWQNGVVASDFWQQFPKDDIKAERKTEVRMTYDDNFLYVAATCYDTTNHIIQTLRRDVNYWDSDGFAITIDPVNEKTYGFLFGVSPLGVQTEALLGTFQDEIGTEWDNRWYSNVKQYEDRWTVEMAIPFKTLRYEADRPIWGINFIRNDLKNNEYHAWTKVPVQFETEDFGYMGALVWDNPPRKVNGNVSLIPYLTGGTNANYEADGKLKTTGNVGLDAKIAVTSSLNLDLTINPDFSQIEVDEQVTNLTRFNIFFPERRNFFLENSDLFANFGLQPVRPFFSRTIGLDADRQPVPIIAGARLSGNLNKNLRMGVMNMQTGKKDEVLAQNYTAVALQQRVFGRSRVQGMLLNRSAFDDGKLEKDDYGRNASFEFVYQNKGGEWTSWLGLHESFKPNITKDKRFYNTGFLYQGRQLEFLLDWVDVGTNFYADMGFIQRIENEDAERDTVVRLGFKHIYNELGYNFFPKNSTHINIHGLNIENFHVWNPDYTFNERKNTVGYFFLFKNGSIVEFGVENNLINLAFPFAFTDDAPLPKARYDNYGFGVEYNSDPRKTFVYEAEVEHSWQFYNGTLSSLRLGLLYRVQPWGNFSVDFEYNNLKLPAEYGEEVLFLVRPRIEVNFSKSLFWTTFLQLNTQGENFNINSRFQWRFAPMSDLFIVYTDNYLVDTETIGSRFRFNDFAPKNRGLVFKLNYWLTL